MENMPSTDRQDIFFWSKAELQHLNSTDITPWLPHSFARNDEPLASSIRAEGLIRPLWVWPDGSELKLVAGRRRLAILTAWGIKNVPALVMPKSLSRPKAMALSFIDNFERDWNQAETALLWHFLADALPEAEALKLAVYLGLEKTPKIRGWCEMAATLPESALTALATEALDLETAARLSTWADEDQAAGLELFATLEPSRQKKKQWLDWLEDLQRIENQPPRYFIKSPEIAAALATIDRRGRPSAGQAALESIWARRHPMLAALRQRREKQLKSFALPPSIKFMADQSFEDLVFTLNFTFNSLKDFKTLAAKISALAEQPEFRKLLEEDGGHDNE